MVVQGKENIQTPSEVHTNVAGTYASPSAAVGGYYIPLHPSGRSWEVSRKDVDIIKVIGKGAFSKVAQATLGNVRGNQERETVAVKMLKGLLVFIL